jgi:acyl-CoA reductase-like NAD-dependent aldehyde dehydrogenase
LLPQLKVNILTILHLSKGFTQAARSTQEDIDLALDAAHEAFPSWSTTSVTERSNMLKIAQVMEDNLEYLATLETIDNGKPIRESRAADILIVSITSVISLVLSVQMKEDL